jgi:putative ABC transport system permease protein
MMPDRKMFWRILRRLLSANRGRLFVILLALGSGAAITAALLNLQVDAKRRLTTVFRAFGPNVVIVPKDSSTTSATLPESIASKLPHVDKLFLIAKVSDTGSGKTVSAVIVGSDPFGYMITRPLTIAPNPAQANSRTVNVCAFGVRVANELQTKEGSNVLLSFGRARESCRVAASAREAGGPEDDRVEVPLPRAQQLANLPGRISLVELRVPGTSSAIENYVANLQRQIPEADVRPIRQFTEGEARIYNRISGILSATVALVLVLTALCVMAAMTNVAMERRNDVGLMKAIGGATRRVLRLFLAEAAILGLTGGILGAAVGILLSMWLGKAVFGVAARPRLIVYPVAVALTIIVAIAGAFPLRRLASIRPAAVFRGEA